MWLTCVQASHKELVSNGDVTLNVSSCIFFNGTALQNGGGLSIEANMIQLANKYNLYYLTIWNYSKIKQNGVET